MRRGAMVAGVRTIVSHGIDMRPVNVQAQMALGLPASTVVGPPDKALAASRERMRSLLRALGEDI